MQPLSCWVLVPALLSGRGPRGVRGAALSPAFQKGPGVAGSPASQRRQRPSSEGPRAPSPAQPVAGPRPPVTVTGARTGVAAGPAGAHSTLTLPETTAFAGGAAGGGRRRQHVATPWSPLSPTRTPVGRGCWAPGRTSHLLPSPCLSREGAEAVLSPGRCVRTTRPGGDGHRGSWGPRLSLGEPSAVQLPARASGSRKTHGKAAAHAEPSASPERRAQIPCGSAVRATKQEPTGVAASSVFCARDRRRQAQGSLQAFRREQELTPPSAAWTSGQEPFAQDASSRVQGHRWKRPGKPPFRPVTTRCPAGWWPAGSRGPRNHQGRCLLPRQGGLGGDGSAET